MGYDWLLAMQTLVPCCYARIGDNVAKVVCDVLT